MNQHINPTTHDPLAERHWASIQERLRTATRTLTSMERENADLREWIRDQGQQSDTCTYHILGKEICKHCQCGRVERSSPASSE
jgi:hypothetical protein